MSDLKQTALVVTQQTLYVVSPALARLVEATTGAINEAVKAGDKGELQALQLEAQRQEIMMSMAERQAKVTQELALAHRIETAEDVEMEEFYDVSGSGELGIKSDSSAVTAGLSGHGQKVTKRIFRFKGHGSPSNGPAEVHT
jgi:hypothetical protein